MVMFLATALLLLLSSLFSLAVADQWVADSTEVAKYEWPVTLYKTEKFNTPKLAIQKNGATDPGYLFFAPTGVNATQVSPMITTEQGELIWQPEHSGNTSKNNFRIQSIKNTQYLTYWDGVMINTFGHGYGSIRILDRTYKQIYNFCPDLKTVTTDGETYACYLDMHENYVTDKGTVVTTAYNVTPFDLTSVGGPKHGWIFDSQFYEWDIATGKKLFSWRSIDQLNKISLKDSFYPLSLDNTTFGSTRADPWDWFHINSVEPLKDGYLVNSRHLWAFFKVNKVTGEIEFECQGKTGADFSLGPGLNYSWQHDPRVGKVTADTMEVHLYDNANSEAQTVDLPTRGLLLNLNLKTRHATLVRDLHDPKDIINSHSQGSYQPLAESHVFLGYGAIAKLREFDGKGKTIYTAEFGPIYNPGGQTYALCASYRAFKFAWKGLPYKKPKVVATAKKGQVDVYMSWNGATEYNKWAVYVGKSAATASSKPVVISKRGFETKYSVSGHYKYVKVEALKDGKVLSSSKVVKVE